LKKKKEKIAFLLPDFSLFAKMMSKN